MEIKQYIYIQKSVDVGDMLFLHPTILRYIAFTSEFCKSANIKCYFSSMIREWGKSRTHAEGRAVDLSLRDYWGWTPELIDIFEKLFYNEFKDVGAISLETGKSVPIYIHDNEDEQGNKVGGQHAHLQCRP